MTKTVGDKRKPGTRLIPTGLVILALGFALLIINLTNPVTSYVQGAGMVTTQTPSAGSIILIALGLLTASIGFGMRLIAAVEK
ncbi:hypothetical protein [Paenarthrobacter ilicis]|uniref:hypothetical protein n=1 Tax=Paenarthrobacter ilicis TaxID=43665 RepID=UPI003863D3E5